DRPRPLLSRRGRPLRRRDPRRARRRAVPQGLPPLPAARRPDRRHPLPVPGPLEAGLARRPRHLPGVRALRPEPSRPRQPPPRRSAAVRQAPRLHGPIHDRLASGEARADLAARLLAQPEDGSIKLYVTWTALSHRRANPKLYQQGTYRPLESEGDRTANVVGF